MIIRRAEQTVLNFPWNGENTKYTLDHHIVSHRATYTDMVHASDNMQYQPPNDHTIVKRLLNSIVSTEIKVISAIKTILTDDKKRDIFEDADDFLLIAVAVSVPEYNMNHTISGVANLVNDNNAGFKIGDVGKTGVELRYYSRDVFKNLPQKQHNELASWNRRNQIKGKEKVKAEEQEKAPSKP